MVTVPAAILAQLQAQGRIPATEKSASTPKYRNRKTVVDGITFDSAKEASRYQELKLLERAGKISDLRLQVSFELCPVVYLDGRKQRPMCYVADFVYDEAGKTITEDAKGFKTKEYRDKRKLMKHVHGIEILET